MKKVFVVGLLILMSMLAGSAFTADLQAGWYAKFSVRIEDYDYQGVPYTQAVGWFITEPGTYDPFVVTDGMYHSRYYREVSVNTDSYGIGTSASLDLPVGFGMTIGDPIGWMDIGWDTNYDASQLFLQLWQTKLNGEEECVWSQQLSGSRFGNTDILQNTQLEGDFFFRVNVVPEPSSIVGLFGFLGAGGFIALKRRQI